MGLGLWKEVRELHYSGHFWNKIKNLILVLWLIYQGNQGLGLLFAQQSQKHQFLAIFKEK